MPAGRVTFFGASKTPPEHFGHSLYEPKLWLRFEYVNTTDSTVTVAGFRGAPGPVIRASDGTQLYSSAGATSFSSGSGGWAPGQDGLRLPPGGHIWAQFGISPTRRQYVHGKSTLVIRWTPTAGATATFKLH